MSGGIYLIRNRVNGQKYYGSAVRFDVRWPQHRGDLKRGAHENPHLQAAWNLHGAENFVFEVVELMRPDLTLKSIRDREQWYLDNVVRWGVDYNINPNASCPPPRTGTGMPMVERFGEERAREIIEQSRAGRQGVQRTDEQRERISEGVLRAKAEGKNPPRTGPFTEEHKAKLSEIRKQRWQDPEYRARMLEARRVRMEKEKASGKSANGK